jgi:hypothetical protein
MSNFKNMFSPTPDGPDPSQKPIPPEEDAVLERVAKKVIQWNMAVPAILFLESIKPLNYIGAQAMVFFEPIVQSIFSIKDYDTFRIAMERRENIENLLQKIEAQDAVAYKREKIYKRKAKQMRKNWTWYQRWLGIKRPRIEITPEEIEAYEKELAEKRAQKAKKRRSDPKK